MGSEDQQGVVTPSMKNQVRSEIRDRFLKRSDDKFSKPEVARRPLSVEQQQAKVQLSALLGAKKSDSKLEVSPAITTTVEPTTIKVDTASIPTPPPLPETLTAEQKEEQKAVRRKAAEEKRQAEQQQSDEEEKKAIEAQIASRKKSPLAPVIADSFRAAIAKRKFSEENEGEEDWDEEVVASTATIVTNPEPVITLEPSVAVTAASVDKPSLPQEQIHAPEVSVKREPIIAQSQEVKAEDRSALLQAIRGSVKLKKHTDSKEEQNKEVPSVVLPPKAPELRPAETEPNLLHALQQDVRFKAAKERLDNEVTGIVTPAVAATPLQPGKDEWNQGFNRIRQRNIPFQYVPEADLKKGIEAFNQKKAAKTSESAAGIAPKPAVASAPAMTLAPQPAVTVDSDRDYALALHLDELQRSDKASDRELADNPEYLRSLQEAYDNDNKRNAKDFEQLEVSAQKEVRHQNLDKEPQVNVVETPKPKAHQRRLPETQVEVRQSAQDRYVAQSLSLTVMILVEQRSFALNGTSANLFMSCSCLCLSYHESVSLNKDGSISHSVSQSLSYTQTNMALSDNGESIVSTSLALSYNKQVSLSSCPHMSFFGKGAASKPAAIPKALSIDMDKVSPIGLPAAAAA